MTTKTIELKSSISWHEKQLSSIELKEPSALDYVQLGEPTTYARGVDGYVYMIQNDGVICQYLDRLLKVDGGTAVLSQLTLEDGVAIKDTLLGFFSAATRAAAA